MNHFRPQIALSLLGLAAVFAVLVLGSVGASSPTQPATATYVEAMVGAAHFVNPLLASGDADLDLTHLVFSGLTRVDSKGDIAPDLASGWEVSPDSRVFTFTIRPDARWHDGQPVTSSDVLLTLAILKDKAFPGDANLASPWRDVQVTAPSESTVRFTLTAPDSAFIEYTTLGILPQHLWEDVKPSEMRDSPLNTLPVGSGAWRYEGVTVASAPVTSTASTPGVVLERVAPLEDTVSQGKMPFTRIWFRPYPTFGAALTALRLGEIHGLGHVPADRVDEVRDIPGVNIHQETLARYSVLLVNTRAPIFDKVETRQALELVLDRDSIARAAHGAPAFSPVLGRSWAYDPTSWREGYNPSEARRLLDRAGWLTGQNGIRQRDGVPLTVVLAANKDAAYNADVARLIQSQLKAVGVDVQLALVDQGTLLSDYLAPRSYHLALANWVAPGADPDLYAYWHSSQNDTGLNFTGWSNLQADRALQGAREVPAKEARKRLYAEFQQAFAQDVPGVVLYNPLYTFATRDPAEGITLPRTDLLSPAQRFDTLFSWYLRAGGLR